MSISWSVLSLRLDGQLHQAARARIASWSRAAASGFISPRPLKRVTTGLARAFSAAMRFEHCVALGLVERVEHLLAGVDAIQRRHRDVDVAGRHQRPEVPQEQRAQQRRDVLPVGVRVREDADLVIAQADRSRRAGIDADRDADVVHFLRAQRSRRLDLPGVQDLAAQRHDGLELAVARLLGRAAGGIALDQEQLASALGSWLVQSASLPGSAGPADDALAHDLLRGLERAPARWRSRTARSARRRPGAG